MSAPMVMTPSGLRPHDKVVKVEPHHVVDGSGGRWRIRDRKTGHVVADHGHRDQVAPGLSTHRCRKPLPSPSPSAPDPGSGWIVYGIWDNTTGTPMTSMTATWTVPADPVTSSGQLIFLFDSFENAGDAIVQPVLQWGVSPAGGGNFWAITNWYVTTSMSFYSTLTTVLTGDVLTGVITGTTSGFDYDSTFTGHPETTLSMTGVNELMQATITLEAYTITAQSDYPDFTVATRFDFIEVVTNGVDPVLAWVPVELVTDFGQRVDIVSYANPNGVIDIYYGIAPTVRPSPLINVPIPCCDDHAPSDDPNNPVMVATGPIQLPVLPAWTRACNGGGVVPTQADLSDVESWV